MAQRVIRHHYVLRKAYQQLNRTHLNTGKAVRLNDKLAYTQQLNLGFQVPLKKPVHHVK